MPSVTITIATKAFSQLGRFVFGIDQSMFAGLVTVKVQCWKFYKVLRHEIMKNWTKCLGYI